MNLSMLQMTIQGLEMQKRPSAQSGPWGPWPATRWAPALLPNPLHPRHHRMTAAPPSRHVARGP